MRRLVPLVAGAFGALGVCDVLEGNVAYAIPPGSGGGGGADGCTDALGAFIVAGVQRPSFTAPGATELSLLASTGIPVHLAVVETSYSVHPCGGPTARKTTAPFIWKLDVPAGSKSTLNDPKSALPSFTPDRVGNYVAHLVGCPSGCTARLTTIAAGKVIVEPTTVGPEERLITVAVAESGQISPLFAPSNLTDMKTPAPTSPQHYDLARNACSSRAGIVIGNAEWLTTTNWTSATPPYALAEGRVYKSQIAGADYPLTHAMNDVNVNLELDPQYRKLLVDDTPEDKGALLPFGGLEVEWEFGLIPDAMRPTEGDRMSVLGFHIVDCGHEIHTEIHPPIATVAHRPREVKLPAQFQYAQQGGRPVGAVQPIGSNVIVPGVVSDVWVHLNGGEILSASGGLAQPANGPCVPGSTPAQCPSMIRPAITTAGTHFRFHVYLPPSPTYLLRQVMTPTFDPALFVQIIDHPQAAALGASTNLAVTEVERVLDGPYPYLTYDIDLSSLSPGQKFTKRIEAAWVYPDLTGKNFGLHGFRIRLNHMKVTDTGDYTVGDWKLWVETPSIDAPWIKLTDCHDCIDTKTYSPTASIWQPGAMDSTGLLKGEFFLFQPPNLQVVPSGRLRFTGYDEDLVSSDGMGAFDVVVSQVADREQSTVCDPANPNLTDCPGFTLSYSIIAGTTPTEGLDPAARAGFQGLLIHPLVVAAANRFRAIDSELYMAGPMTARRRQVVFERKTGEATKNRTVFEPAALKLNMQKATVADQEALVVALRKHALAVLGPNPTAAQRAKAARELVAIKPSIPAALYKKYLCDVETGRPCP